MCLKASCYTMRCTDIYFIFCMVVFLITSMSKDAVVTASSCINCHGDNLTCVDGNCLPRCVSVTSSGECLRCRDSRFYGKHCENVCPDTCLNSHCQLDNSRFVCTEGCVKGKKGGNCGVDCPAGCTQCERHGDKCIGNCSNPQFFGDLCDLSCPDNCRGGCSLVNSTIKCTEGCVDGKKGDNCEVDCLAGCIQCERYGDKCIGNCSNPRYYGDFCNQPCPHNCRGGCSLVNSIVKCTERCVGGKKGDNCEVDCSASCTECERYGQRCVGSCSSPKYYGNECEKSCPRNCNGGCDRDTGSCDSCVIGYTGLYCNCSRCTECDTDCVNKPDGGPSTLVFVGIVLMSVAATGFILFIVVLVLRKRRRRDKKSTDGVSVLLNTVGEDAGDRSCKDMISATKSITTTNPTYMLSGELDVKLVNYCEELQSEDSDLKEDYIMNEFLKLPSPDVKAVTHGCSVANIGRNRYKDVLPFDENRVVLETEDDDETDYINASYINGYRNQIRYVAAQGPSLLVIDDFWRMIWQLNTTKIVMLTNLVEAGKVKCEMYWPFCSSEYQTFGNVCVQCVEEKVYQFYTLRTLAVWKGKAKTRTIRQFHFTAWPDHGVPEETKSIIEFHRVVKDTGHNALGPMVIHCSAGVGRTGTFIALDFLLDQARYEGSVCVYKCIEDFRLQRMKMVQTKQQYKFVYSMLASALQFRGTLPRYYSPVLLQCEMCWEKKNKTECGEDDTSDGRNDEDYQPLWNCGPESTENCLSGNYNPLLDMCAVISEDSPPLLKTPLNIQVQDEDSENEDNEKEKQKLSWVTAL